MFYRYNTKTPNKKLGWNISYLIISVVIFVGLLLQVLLVDVVDQGGRGGNLRVLQLPQLCLELTGVTEKKKLKCYFEAKTDTLDVGPIL